MAHVNDIATEIERRLKTSSDNLDDNLHLSIEDRVLFLHAIKRIHKLESLLIKRNDSLLRVKEELTEVQDLLINGEDNE